MWIASGPMRAASRLSLRLKLTLWVVLISVAIQLSLALVVLLYQRASIGNFLTDRLLVRAGAIGESLRRYDFQVTDQDLAKIAGDNIRQTLFSKFMIAVYSGDGSLVACNLRPAPSADEADVRDVPFGAGIVRRLPLPAVADRPGDTSTQRLVLRRFKGANGADYVLLLATTDVYYDSMLGLSGQVIGLAAAAGVLAAAVAGWLIAGIATAPLYEMSRLAGSFSPEEIESDVELPPSSLSSRELTTLKNEVQEARARLREALHAQDRFISSVSHELKTPIAVLLAEAQTIDARGLTPDSRKFIQSVTEEMRRLGRMVESFLTLTKVRGGMTIVEPKIHALNDIVLEAVRSCGKMARQYGVTLLPDLADGDAPPTVSGDADLLRVMMDNLIHNAIRFSPEGQCVFIRVAADAAGCEVTVRDSGPGVPEDLKDKLFERFVQAPREVQRGRGHGLGLTIAQGIAELHRGRISVTNVEGGGCQFTVTLPAAREPQKTPLPDTGAAAGAEPASVTAPG